MGTNGGHFEAWALLQLLICDLINYTFFQVPE